MKGKNGFANYQTWNVVLWLSNDERLYRACLIDLENFKATRTYYKGAYAKSLVLTLLPEGTPDLKGMPRPYAGVRWAEVAKVIRELA